MKITLTPEYTVSPISWHANLERQRERGGEVREGWENGGEGGTEDKRGGWKRRMRFFKIYFS